MSDHSDEIDATGTLIKPIEASREIYFVNGNTLYFENAIGIVGQTGVHMKIFTEHKCYLINSSHVLYQVITPNV